MANEKLIAGAVMILLNLVVLAPIATSMVEGAVEDNFETGLTMKHVLILIVQLLKKTGQRPPLTAVITLGT